MSNPAVVDLDDEGMTEAELERLLAQRRLEIAAKLAAARDSIQCGDIAPLEPLPVLLRAARRNVKTTR